VVRAPGKYAAVLSRPRCEQDASAQICLHLGHGIRINAGGRVKDDARRRGMNISIALAWHFLKHAIDHTGVEVHMPVQAGAEPVDKGHGTNVQRSLVQLRHPRAARLQALGNDPQEKPDDIS
jgi:hypothetical protein